MKPTPRGEKSPPTALFNGPDKNGMRPFARSLPMALLLTREAVMKGFRELIQLRDLNEQQWRVLRALVDEDQMETGALADQVCLLRPSLTRILRTLEDRGLIRKRRKNNDRRFSYISLTQKGRRVFNEIAPLSEKEYQRIEKSFGKKNLDKLYDLLEQLTDALEDQRNV